MRATIFLLILATLIPSMLGFSPFEKLQNTLQITSENAITKFKMMDANPSCTLNSECGNNGRCHNNKCQCDSGYYTQTSTDPCGYKQKQQVTAFCLQLFLGGFGAGHFYVGEIGLAVGELILTLISGGIYKSIKKEYKNKSKPPLIECIYYIMSSALTASFGWWLYNTIQFGENKFNDINGMPLQAW